MCGLHERDTGAGEGEDKGLIIESLRVIESQIFFIYFKPNFYICNIINLTDLNRYK